MQNKKLIAVFYTGNVKSMFSKNGTNSFIL